MLRGIVVTIVIAETGHREADIQAMGIPVLHRPDTKMQCAVIDQHICWYGSINLIGRSIDDATSIRITSSDFASALLDALTIP